MLHQFGRLVPQNSPSLLRKVPTTFRTIIKAGILTVLLLSLFLFVRPQAKSPGVELVIEVDSCSRKFGEMLLFCRAASYTGTTSRYAHYSSKRQSCVWKPNNGTSFSLAYPDTHKARRLQSEESPTMFTCEFQDDKFNWTVHRLGAFTTTGGSDALFGGAPLNIDIANPAPFSHRDEENRILLNGAFQAAVTTEDGYPIAWPPLRMHHANLLVPSAFYTFLPFNSDYPCFSDQGSALCYLHQYPDDFAVEVFEEILVSSLPVDSRIEHSPPLSFFMEYGYRWTSSPRVLPISFVQLLTPIIVNRLSADAYFPSMRGTDVMWCGTELEHPGTLLHVTTHTHHIHDHTHFIFSARPTDVGFNKAPFEKGYSAAPFLLEDIGYTAAELKDYMLAHLDAAVSSCRVSGCKYTPGMICQTKSVGLEDYPPHVAANLGLGTRPGKYGRQVLLDCSPFAISKNNPMTGVFLSAPIDLTRFATYRYDELLPTKLIHHVAMHFLFLKEGHGVEDVGLHFPAAVMHASGRRADSFVALATGSAKSLENLRNAIFASADDSPLRHRSIALPEMQVISE